jgi:hypothetical protein
MVTDLEAMLLAAGCEPALTSWTSERGLHRVRVRVAPAHRFGALEEHPETAGEGTNLEEAIDNALAHLRVRVAVERAKAGLSQVRA